MHKTIIGLVAAGAFAASPAFAGDPKAGRQKALQCQTCHGLTDGLSKLPEAPNLAGQVEVYLVSSLNAYKSGERKNDMMSAVAPSLSTVDIEDLAAYFSGIKVTVEPSK